MFGASPQNSGFFLASLSSSGICESSLFISCPLCALMASLRVSRAMPNCHTVFLHVVHRLASSAGCELAGAMLYGTSVLQPVECLEQKQLIWVRTRCAVQPMREPIFSYGTQCHLRYPKTPLLAYGLQRYGCLGRHPRTQTIFLGIVHLKHHHPRCPKTPLTRQPPIPLYPIGQQRCFWIPGMVVFELQNAMKYCLGSWVAPQAARPLYPIDQQRCFQIPVIVVFLLHNAKKFFGLWDGAPNTHTTTPRRAAKVLLDT